MEKKTVILIPARYDSTRFPGKPLAPILGKPMIERVYERAKQVSGVSLVAVATDSEKIFAAVKSFGGEAVMTRGDHLTGSDRLAEAADILGLLDSDVVVNVQGDQPALNPAHVSSLVESMRGSGASPVSTLAASFGDPVDVLNENHVKVVLSSLGRALYFSRAPIPYFRSGSPARHLKHVGIYAYQAGFLREFVKLPQGDLERAEGLEQLRALERGYPVSVLVVEGAYPEVDVPEDLLIAERVLSEQLRSRPKSSKS
ncbi:MAG: 3-deoxy-manno-octulosonate cytidylyltransferase [Deltaproteobacteria bacterium]|nr:3-deoxy-manno-octulosonate cytidylyltransferase [Deltaproteobacteria bacterium]